MKFKAIFILRKNTVKKKKISPFDFLQVLKENSNYFKIKEYSRNIYQTLEASIDKSQEK